MPTGKRVCWRLCVSLTAVFLSIVLMPALASAHVERGGYWPDPAADCAIQPCSGGQLPVARSLASALDTNATHVVCQPDSLTLTQQAIDRAKTVGYTVRPTQAPQTISAAEGRALMDLNRKFFKRCSYDSIQAAVTDSGNNARVVVMPGLYTEPESRAAPTHDPACAQYQLPATTRARRARCPTSRSSTAPTTRT